MGLQVMSVSLCKIHEGVPEPCPEEAHGSTSVLEAPRGAAWQVKPNESGIRVSGCESCSRDGNTGLGLREKGSGCPGWPSPWLGRACRCFLVGPRLLKVI